MALDALVDMDEVVTRHPDARQGLVSAIGEDLLAEITTARETIARAVARLDAPTSRDESAT